MLPRNSHEVTFQATAQGKVFRLFALFVKKSKRKQQEWHLQKKNLDRYRTSYTCMLTSYFCCFTCESLSIVFELFFQRKCRVLANKVQTADVL